MNPIQNRLKELEEEQAQLLKQIEEIYEKAEKCKQKYIKKDMMQKHENWCFEFNLLESEKQGILFCLKEVNKIVNSLKVIRFKSIDEQDKFHMKGWNDVVFELKEKLETV